jgi:hypothetical protein
MTWPARVSIIHADDHEDFVRYLVDLDPFQAHPPLPLAVVSHVIGWTSIICDMNFQLPDEEK